MKKVKSKQTVQGLPPSDWRKFFIAAGVGDDDKTSARSDRGKEIRLGNFLSKFVGRSVPISVKGRSGTATLRLQKGRSNRKHYHFEIRWDADQTTAKSAATTPPVTGGKAVSRPK